MYTCIRCYQLLDVAPHADDNTVIVCPTCGFCVPLGDLKFFREQLGVTQSCPLCEGTGRVSLALPEQENSVCYSTPVSWPAFMSVP